MKGIVLTGGISSRLQPLTKFTSKTLLPVGEKPMIQYSIELLVSSGIKDICLITRPEHIAQFASLFGTGENYDCSIYYCIQEVANGIASAIKLCQGFVGGERFAVVLGDNIFENNTNVSKSIKKFQTSNDDYALFTKKVPDPERFGIPVYKDGKIVDVIEKPKNPSCDEAIVGLYCYTYEAFDIIDTLKPSARGEYEVSDINSFMVKNRKGTFNDVGCGWIDAGTHESYRLANKMMVTKCR
jgi:glucose-1-phosphate thymidylyltransferase